MGCNQVSCPRAKEGAGKSRQAVRLGTAIGGRGVACGENDQTGIEAQPRDFPHGKETIIFPGCARWRCQNDARLAIVERASRDNAVCREGDDVVV